MIGSRTCTVYLFLDSFELADDLLKSRQFFCLNLAIRLSSG